MAVCCRASLCLCVTASCSLPCWWERDALPLSPSRLSPCLFPLSVFMSLLLYHRLYLPDLCSVFSLNEGGKLINESRLKQLHAPPHPLLSATLLSLVQTSVGLLWLRATGVFASSSGWHVFGKMISCIEASCVLFHQKHSSSGIGCASTSSVPYCRFWYQYQINADTNTFNL